MRDLVIALAGLLWGVALILLVLRLALPPAPEQAEPCGGDAECEEIYGPEEPESRIPEARYA